jgi:hypothetical protein
MADDETYGQRQAQGIADRLAFAFEEVGFDVGQDFPGLQHTVDQNGNAVVRIGDVKPDVAAGLATVLIEGPAWVVNKRPKES